MKYILVLSLLMSSLFAFGENIQNFEADFVQTITDEENKTLTYAGTMHAKRPNSVLWLYTDPINKKIYVNSKFAVIVEPELEQAIVKKLEGEIDFFGILASAQIVDKNHYKAIYKNISFTLKERDGVIEALSYTDPLENKVQIRFSKQKQNRPMEQSLFTPKIPKEFDIIQE
ncbi:MAG: outer membrane lipoprotein chaperone LolA [Campylobacterales bacterium]|nr:outer membrane lipoprotein chaperone LolA [Campylobacterales bacterium]